jgi:hypothetical protein
VSEPPTPASRARISIGLVLLALSLLPWAAAPLVPLLGMPHAATAGVIAALLVGAEIVGACSVLVLGRESIRALRAKLRIRRLRRGGS